MLGLSAKRRVGFIGLGAMGSRMAVNLLKKNFDLTVYDIRNEAVESLVSKGAKPANNPKEVGERSEVAVLSLPSQIEVSNTVLGENGLLEGLDSGGIIVDTSTIDPSTARRIWLKAKEKEVGAVDAPVSGGTVGAEMGTLTIMVGGEKETVDACMDVLRAIGKNIYYVGGPGSGQIFKLLNNMLVGINLAAVGEALVLASKAGVDLKLLYEVIKTSAGNSWAFENKAPNMFEDRFEPGFRVWLQHKDLGLALNMASEQSIPTPLLAFTYAMFESAKALGLENMDHSSIVKVFEAMSNTKVSRYKP